MLRLTRFVLRVLADARTRFNKMVLPRLHWFRWNVPQKQYAKVEAKSEHVGVFRPLMA
jgi:hypothetical protein